jgi:hypothetical protein
MASIALSIDGYHALLIMDIDPTESRARAQHLLRAGLWCALVEASLVFSGSSARY